MIFGLLTTALVILCLNEIDGMKKIVPKIKKEWVNEIVLVDGGSTDGSLEEAKKLGIKIINQKIKGHGAAILAGVNATKSDNIVFFGPDGNNEPEEIPLLIAEMSKKNVDQIMCSRFAPESINLDAGAIDTFGNKMFAFLANTFFGGNWTDVLNESRIITRKAWNELNFDAMKFDSTYQMSIRGMKLKQKMAEIVGNEGARIGGERKIQSFGTGCVLLKRFFIELFKKV